MMTPTIRTATVEDLDASASLFDAYRQFYGQPPDLPGSTAFVRERLTNGDSVILLAIAHEEPVGFVQLYPSFSSVSMRRVWILNDLFVTEHARRSGIARQLIARAEHFAKSSDAKGLVLATQKTNTAAQALYEATGWVRDDVFDHYHRFFA